MSLLTDFDITYVLSAAEVDVGLNAAGIRGQELFDGLAAYGQTTTATPLTYAQMAQTYIVPDVAAVQAVMKADGIRGHPFFEAILLGAAA